MTYLATIVIPSSIEHQTLLPRAIASANKQTIPCKVVHAIDADRNGTGYMRNRLTEMAVTPFVVWLDADDWLEPNAIEEMAKRYTRGGYVFCDYYVDGKVSAFSTERLFTTNQAHGVTTLFPVKVWRALGGFNEQHPAEDSDFYLRAIDEGMCPIYCNQPLFTYSLDGQRSLALKTNSELYRETIYNLRERYQGAYIKMSCCGGGALRPQEGSKPFEGAILVEALYPPMRQWGKASGIVYDAPAMQGSQMWVHADDVKKNPTLWRPIIDVNELSPDVSTVLALAERSKQMYRAVDTDEFKAIDTQPQPETSTTVEPVKRKRRTRKARS